MSITAPAPSFVGGGRFRLVERSYPEPGPGELLLRVAANAVCGTDRELYLNGSAVIPGHEAAGVVFLGGEGTSTPVGTRGVVFLMDFCGQCRSCLVGATNQCLAKRADMGFTHDGGYGPYELVHESNFFPVGDTIDIANATMLLDVMGTSGHALTRAGLLRTDIESVYIAGAGPIGLGLLLMAQLRYGRDVPVYISDVSPWRLGLAERLGGIVVDAADPRNLQAVGTPDVAFDASGKTAARRAAMDILGKRGVMVCVGHGEGLTLEASGDLIAPEHAVLGSEYFLYADLQKNLELLQAHEDVVGQVVTHRFPVGAIAEAFDVFMSGEAGKVVVLQD